MIEAMIDVQDVKATREVAYLQTIRGILRGLLEKGVVDAWLVPMRFPGGLAPMLVTDPAALEQADPLAPVLPINAARAASQLTMTGNKAKLGVVLRSCEIRALVELVKFQQAKLENVLIVGVDCLGTYGVKEWQAAGDQAAVTAGLLAGALTGELAPYEGMAFRSACQICEQPLPEGDHVALTIGLLGAETGRVYLKAREDLAEALEVTGDASLAASGVKQRKAAADKLIAGRVKARDAAFVEVRERVAGQGLEGLLGEFATCIRCHNCMVNCPICYCRECIFRTPTFEHESELFYQWAERKGTVRMLPDTLLFHLTRLNHMVSSCVGCGLCSDACPVEIPVATVFRAVGEKVQALFDYRPGRSLADAAPVQEFREDELTALGERPH